MEVIQELAKVLAEADRPAEVLESALLDLAELRVLLAQANRCQAAVAGDPVDPGPEVDRLGGAVQILQGGDERRLDASSPSSRSRSMCAQNDRS